MFDRFADPQYLWLLLMVPILMWWYWRRRSAKGATIRYSHLGIVRPVASQSATRLRHLLFGARMLALALMIVAFARPQTGVTDEEVLTEGIDILMVLDISSSMLAEDLEPNRLTAAKDVAAQFIRGRSNDRIGLVIFAGQAFTQAPLTLDYDVILSLLEELEVGLVEDGTAVGMGLATAVKRLKDSAADSKIIVLLTDGRNNRGEIDPITAAQMAQSLGIRVYTVGAGTRDVAPYTVDDPVFGRRRVNVQVDIDEESLRAAADLTGGRYFRATDRESLRDIYQEIDQLEKTEIEVRHYTRYGELFHLPLVAGLVLLVAEMGLGNTALRKIP